MSRLSSFQRLAVATTALTYVLIAVGGLVRASGSGLGCPDWPRCFGSWIPPATAELLPPEFDRALFNPARMWTEYLNRLLGVSVGFAILATAISAWRTHRERARVVWPVTVAVLLTGYQGWLGGRVVAHELAPWIVTAHMVVALIIVQLLLWATVESLREDRASALLIGEDGRRALGWAAWAVTALLLVQVALGTQVRGKVDDALAAGVTRATVLLDVGRVDATHRQLAALVSLAVVGLWAWTLTRFAHHRPLVQSAHAGLLAVGVQVIAGLALAVWALPPVAQVVHLTAASLLLGALTVLGLVAWRWPAPFRGSTETPTAA